MTCRRDTSVIIITINRNYDLIDVAADLKMSRFINYYLSIKKILSSVLSAFCLDV